MSIEEVLAALHNIAAEIDAPYQHWLGGADADQGPSYCRPCAEAAVAEGKGESVDGGWKQYDDGCSHCEGCGRVLEYDLTERGAMAELEHFQANLPTAPICADTAFHIAKLLECHNDNPEVLELLPAVVAALQQEQDKP